jgi:nucleoside-diphosphate-sugar epimerase
MAGAGRRRVLVVGGTSGAGAEVVRLLHARDRSVRVLARRPAEARRRLPEGVEIVRGDLRDPRGLPAAVTDVDTIVHTASPRGFLRSGQHREVVVDGTAELLRAARRASAPGIVFVSSMGVTQTSPLGRGLDLVKGDALTCKRLAEGLIRRSRLDFLVLRAAVLTDGCPQCDRVVFATDARPLQLRTRIARVDLAWFIVEAIELRCLGRVTGDLYWGDGVTAGRPVAEALATGQPHHAGR